MANRNEPLKESNNFRFADNDGFKYITTNPVINGAKNRMI